MKIPSPKYPQQLKSISITYICLGCPTMLHSIQRLKKTTYTHTIQVEQQLPSYINVIVI